MVDGQRPDAVDKAVYSATHKVRNQYRHACFNLGLSPRELTPVTLMQRSVPG